MVKISPSSALIIFVLSLIGFITGIFLFINGTTDSAKYAGSVFSLIIAGSYLALILVFLFDKKWPRFF